MNEKKWCVLYEVHEKGMNEFITVCESKEKSIIEAKLQWNRLTTKEQKKNHRVMACLINVNESKC